MASKNFTGYLRDPLGEYASFDKWTFTHVTTTGETAAGSTSVLNIGEDGFYNINIEYGQVNIRTRDTINKNTINQGTYVINSETLVSTLPALLNAEVPVTDPVILQMEAILADAEAAADRAEAAAAQMTAIELIINTATYTVGTVLTLSGYLSAGDGGGAQWRLTSVTGQTPSQSPADLGGGLINDANGSQWEMLLSNEFEFDSFTELELSNIGNVGQKLLCRERGRAEYIIMPLTYVALPGDATLSSGLVAQLQVDNDSPVEFFGSLASNADNSTFIQDGIDRLSGVGGGALVFSPNTYLAKELSWKNNVNLYGEHRVKSVLKLIDGANTYLIASSTFIENQEFVNIGTNSRSLVFDSNRSNNTGDHAVVLKTYNCNHSMSTFKNSFAEGFKLSAICIDGVTENSNNLADNSWDHCVFKDNDKDGLLGYDNDANQIADGNVNHCVFNTNATNGGIGDLTIERAAGWHITNNQLYNGGGDVITVDKMSRAVITGNHCDLKGSFSVPKAIGCIRVKSFDPQGSNVIVNNPCILNVTSGLGFPRVIILEDSTSTGLTITGNTGVYGSGSAGEFYKFSGAGEITNCIINNTFNSSEIDEGDSPDDFAPNNTNNNTGVFSPVAEFANNGDFAPTYTQQDGVYSKMGNVVAFSLNVSFDANSYTTASGNFFISGLPFNANENIGSAVAVGEINKIITNDQALSASVFKGSKRVFFEKAVSNGLSISLSSAGVPASQQDVSINVSGVYII